MTKIVPMCGCGNNHEAIDAALRLAKTAFKKEGGCAMWYAAVAEALATLTSQMIKAEMAKMIKQEGALGDIDRDRLNKASQEAIVDIAHRISAGFYQNAEESAKFICDEMGAGDADERAEIAAGPNADHMRSIGFPVDEQPNSILQLLRALGQNSNVQVIPAESLSDVLASLGKKPH